VIDARLVAESLPQFCPTTNHYQCDDGKWLLVTVHALDVAGTLSTLGVTVPIASCHLPKTVDVFLSDETATVLDADGNPANGMTPLAQFSDCATHSDALARLGYTLV